MPVTMQTLSQQPLLQYVQNNLQIDYATYDEKSKQNIREIGIRNMFIQRKLFTLLDHFQAADIPVIVLKGLHFIHEIYPFGVRPIEDIDLLIRREDFVKADHLIKKMGYAQGAVDMDVWTHLAFSNKMTYMDDLQPAIPVDIHLSLGPFPYLGKLQSHVLFAETKQIETEYGNCHVLQEEYLLLHLCLHLYQHLADKWETSCCDMITLIQHHKVPMDWDRFVELVQSYRFHLPVLYSLKKADELAGKKIIPVPFIRNFGGWNQGRPKNYFMYILESSGVTLRNICCNLFLRLE